jgi:hypothetical protein
MKLVQMPHYTKHEAWRDSAQGLPAAHAMRLGGMVVVDANSFLCATACFDDAFYPDEPDRRDDPIVKASFAKGGTYVAVKTPASEFRRIMKTDPPGIICR